MLTISSILDGCNQRREKGRMGNNFLEYVNYLVEECGWSEEAALREAGGAYNICQDDEED
jgi:hypothetical protein